MTKLSPKPMNTLKVIKAFQTLKPLISDSKLSKTLRLLYVFGDGTEVIFATNEDKVYGFGGNRFGCLGLSTWDQCIPEPRVNTTLNNRHLTSVRFGSDHCIGLTSSGVCYAWGDNTDGQLGIGSTESSHTPKLMVELLHLTVTQVCCGDGFSLALTCDGKVYGWGRNSFGQLGDKSFTSRSTPTQIHFKHLCIDSISCGKSHSMALTSTGMVFVWGLNSSGQLGHEHNSTGNVMIANTPHCVPGFKKIHFVKGVCGPNHSLLLSSDGDVYAFGNNHYGQTGTGGIGDNNNNQFIPIKVSEMRFKDIFTSCANDISFGLSMDNKYYVWGLCRKRSVSIPTVIPESTDYSAFDIYAKYSGNAITFESIKVDEDINEDIVCDIKGDNRDTEEIFDDEEVYDDDEEEEVVNDLIGFEDSEEFSHYFKSVLNSTDNDISDRIVENAIHLIGNRGLAQEIREPIADKTELKSGTEDQINDYFNGFTDCRMSSHKTVYQRPYSPLSDDFGLNPNSFDANIGSGPQIKDTNKPKPDLQFETDDPFVDQLKDSSDFNDIFEPKVSENGFSRQSIQTSNDINFYTEDDLNVNVFDNNCGNPVNHSPQPPEPSVPNQPLSEKKLFLKRLHKWFDNSFQSDIEFIVENESIYCHKTVLQIRNNKFYRKCGQYLDKTSVNDRIVIKKYSFKAFKAFIEWLYGKTPEIDGQNCYQLSQLADIYGERELKELCLHCHYVIDLSNVCSLYEMSITDNNTDLKRNCIEFSQNNWKSIIKSQEFEEMNENIAKEFMKSMTD